MSRLKTVGARVATVQPRTPVVQPGSWRGNKTSTQRGYGYRWQKFRERYLAAHPLCVMCEAAGRTTAATVVDHVTPHRGDSAAFWRGPFQGLCAACHSGTKQHMEAGSAS